MAVIVKYVVVWDGKEDMSFPTKQEAEAHDKMLAIAERLSTFLETAELNLAEDTLEANRPVGAKRFDQILGERHRIQSCFLSPPGSTLLVGSHRL